MAKKEEERKKVVSGLEDEQAKATALSCEEVLHEVANFTNTSSSTGKKVLPYMKITII